MIGLKRQLDAHQRIGARRHQVIAALGSLLLIACVEECQLPIADLAVTVTPETTTVRTGATVVMQATVSGAGSSTAHKDEVTWTSSSSTVAAIDATGAVSAISPGWTTITATAGGGERRTATVTVIGDAPRATISLDPSRQFQTMTGWEALPGTGYGECDRDAHEAYLPELFDRTVNELHLNRVRIPLRAGFEHPNDSFRDFNEGKTTFDGWKAVMFRPQNDNDDPFVINPNGFNWGFLDFSIEQLVKPLKQRLQAIGDDLWFSFGYTGANTGLLHRDNPDEYSEFVLAAFQHMRDKHGIVPNSYDIVNEPNLGAWSPLQVAANLVAVKKRLNAAGFFPQFIGPSTSWALGSVQYVDTMLSLPAARDALSEISYHRYGPITTLGNLQALARRGAQYGKRTAMTEHIGSGYEELHADLTIANVSSWQQFGLAFCVEGAGGGGGLYFVIHNARPGQKNPRVVTAQTSKPLRQYFRYVRLGAVRVGATSANAAFAPVAFRNPDGRFTVVVKASSAGAFTVAGLTAGTYGVEYTTAAEYARSLPDARVVTGGVLTAAIPGRGVITLYAKE
jgi:O-glycosyl hydrolase